MTEAHFDPVLIHWCRHHSVDVPTFSLLDVTVLAAGSCVTGVVGSRPVQIYGVVMDLRAQRAPVHPEGVVGPAVQLDACWTAGTYEKKKSSMRSRAGGVRIILVVLDVCVCGCMCMFLSSLDENP